MHPNFRYFCDYIKNTEEKTTMDKEQAVKVLKEILLSNKLTSTEQENALIIAIAELLK